MLHIEPHPPIYFFQNPLSGMLFTGNIKYVFNWWVDVFEVNICYILTVPVLQAQYIHESSDGLYSAFSFMLAYILHMLPFRVVAAVGFAAIIHWSGPPIALFYVLQKLAKYLT